VGTVFSLKKSNHSLIWRRFLLLFLINQACPNRPVMGCCARGACSGMVKQLCQKNGDPEVCNAGAWTALP
jgi:hypothetical protein